MLNVDVNDVIFIRRKKSFLTNTYPIGESFVPFQVHSDHPYFFCGKILKSNKSREYQITIDKRDLHMFEIKN